MRQRLTFSAAWGIILAFFATTAGATLQSTVYETVPGTTAEEFGDRVPGRTRTIPISATLTFDLNATPPSVVAFIPNAVLEGGDPFPLTVRSSSGAKLADGTYRFDGDYLRDIEPSGTQYLFDWRFATSTDGTVLWNGMVGWAGGHAWYLTVSNLALVPLARLSITRAGPGSIQISWPTNVSDYVLECATNLLASGWSTVTNTQDTSGNRIFVIIDTDAPQRFHRLRKP